MGSMSQIGHLLSLQTFGESHGPAIGGILSGVPAGIAVDLDRVQKEMEARRPGANALRSPRNEADEVQWLSGIFEGKTTGSPIGFLIPNADQRSGDYEKLKDVFRPSHADYTYWAKYGIRDYRGGGRASARETACRVAAGALLMPWLESLGMEIKAWVSSIHQHHLSTDFGDWTKEQIRQNLVYCPDKTCADSMIKAIEAASEEGDSLGGIISAEITGVPPGLGEPVYYKLHAALGAAMLSINAVKGFEMGRGFEMTRRKGSEVNDLFYEKEGIIKTRSNHSAGVQGGISNGMPVQFRVAFKPTATIRKSQETLTKSNETIALEAKGRHDPCVVPRAVPIVEAMAALVLADMWLIQQSKKAHEGKKA
jgi:chorismate synthase